MEVSRILETCLYVDDLEAARRFYTGVLGLSVASAVPDRHLFFRCGGQMLLLFNPDTTSEPAGMVPTHGARGPGHIAFAVRDDEIAGWRTTLSENRVAIEKEVSWPGGGHSIYFRDPAGNCLELVTPATWE